MMFANKGNMSGQGPHVQGQGTPHGHIVRHEPPQGAMCQTGPCNIGHDTPYGHRVLPGPDQFQQEVHHQRDHGSQVCQEDLAENIANMSTKWCYEVPATSYPVTFILVARSRLV